ncbi:MAG: recombination protein O N-terminal domain-containing protein [Bacteroidales bacterium]|nr:recombination protein O N-terminal domain-containing protein [Bacteroidales bacterium]MBR4679420.1 recombination protein O N-terminal domain-containing protein [Bacteroidales bacterium]MEE3448252.1 recombination protein O N-terminal domain-containing protein [Bacteroidales bacterium]
MIQKTRAIILQYSKYGDNKLILNTFSEDFGRLSFALKLPEGKNKANVLPYCQPLFQNEIEYRGSNSAVKNIKSISPAVNYATIPKNTAKMSVAMFLSEVLLKTLTYSEANKELYGFISTSLLLLDDKDYKGRNFHLKFLMQLSKYVGFFPFNRYSQQTPCFDIAKSKFCQDIAGSPHFIREPYSKIFSDILDNDILSCEEIPLNGAARSFLLEKILDYYRYRFDSLHDIRSLEILQAVFHNS